MRKFVSLILIILMLGVLGIQRAKAETPIYGDIYLFDSNIPFVWEVLNWQLSPPELTFELNTNTSTTKAVGLVNIGEIVKIFISIPLERSYVSILYQDKIYNYPLTLHKIHENCIVFTFGN